MCYGDFETIYPGLLELPVQQLDLEAANNDFALIELIRKHPFTKEIALGVVDSHDHRIETKDEVVAGIRRALEVLRPEQVLIDPDCGLKTRSWQEAERKLAVIVEAANQVREELSKKPKPANVR
jgi:5-methyltetrahydropteroyltriglutamate--homocysteine methyltransferase